MPYVLLADSDAAAQRLLTSHFAQAGWRYDLVVDGASVLKATTKQSYDVIITDLTIPGVHGLELLKAIQRERPEQAIVVVSSTGSIDDVIGLLRQGVTDYLQKPIDFHSLERVVERIVNGNRRRDINDQFVRFLDEYSALYLVGSADLANLGCTPALIEWLHRAGKINLENKLRIELAFQEALTNSLEHGNLELDSAWKEQFSEAGIDLYSVVKRERLKEERYAKRTLRVQVHYAPGRLTLSIQDEGRGFLQFDNSAEGILASEISCHGRGVSMITKLMEEVRYSEKGTKITMVKYLD